MDEQLDNDLSNRIREVFDNFDDTSFPSADEGWLLLREKFPQAKQKRPVARLWWASVAAAVLLFIGIGIWMINKKTAANNNHLALKLNKQHTVPLNHTDTAKLIASQQPSATPADTTGFASASPKNKHKQLPANVGTTVGTSTFGSPLALAPVRQTTHPAQQPILNNTAKANHPVDSAGNPAVTHTAQTYIAAVNTPSAVSKNKNAIVADAGRKPLVDSSKNLLADNHTNPQKTTTAPASAAGNSIMLQQPDKAKTPPKKNSMEALFASESAQPSKKHPEEDDYTDKKVRFGVYAGTFVNYGKGSSNQMNAGAGFTSDFKLNKNLKLSTGLALAQNSLSYNGAPPTTGGSDARYSAAVAQSPQALVVDKQNLFAANANFPVLKNYNASLVGLDIPINLKYEFNPRKNDTYVLAGLSSGTFINEAYTSVYGYSAASVAAGASAQTTDDITRKNFSGFYFAKTLNVAFGIGYPVGKTNRLIIEPFLKYPLDGLGAQQLQFGAAGLNLKLNFTSPKK